MGQNQTGGAISDISELPLNRVAQSKQISTFWELTKSNIMPKNYENIWIFRGSKGGSLILPHFLKLPHFFYFSIWFVKGQFFVAFLVIGTWVNLVSIHKNCIFGIPLLISWYKKSEKKISSSGFSLLKQWVGQFWNWSIFRK